MIALRSDDLPLDCVPTTTICGSSGILKSSAGLFCSSADSVLATRSTSADESAASGDPSIGPRGVEEPRDDGCAHERLARSPFG